MWLFAALAWGVVNDVWLAVWWLTLSVKYDQIVPPEVLWGMMVGEGLLIEALFAILHYAYGFL